MLTPEEFKAYAVKNNIKGLAVDIDDTISDTVRFVLNKIHQDLGETNNQTPDQLLEKYGKYKSPFWSQPKVLEWWEKNIDGIATKYSIIENSHDVLQKIDQIQPVVCYLTARSERFYESTLIWLRQNHFPDRPLITRPANAADTDDWKANILADLYPQITGIIDDNPGLIEALPKMYQGAVYLYGVNKYPKSHIKVIPCQSWNNIYKKIAQTKVT